MDKKLEETVALKDIKINIKPEESTYYLYTRHAKTGNFKSVLIRHDPESIVRDVAELIGLEVDLVRPLRKAS